MSVIQGQILRQRQIIDWQSCCICKRQTPVQIKKKNSLHVSVILVPYQADIAFVTHGIIFQERKLLWVSIHTETPTSGLSIKPSNWGRYGFYDNFSLGRMTSVEKQAGKSQLFMCEDMFSRGQISGFGRWFIVALNDLTVYIIVMLW